MFCIAKSEEAIAATTPPGYADFELACRYGYQPPGYDLDALPINF